MQFRNWHLQVIRFASYVFLPIGMCWYAADPSHFEHAAIENNLKWHPPVDYEAVDRLEKILRKRREEQLAKMQQEYEQSRQVPSSQPS